VNVEAGGPQTASRLLHAMRFVRALTTGRSAASSVAQGLVIRIAQLVINFGTGVIVARALAPSGRGEQAAMMLWPILLAGLATLGVPTALNYQSRRHPSDAGRLLITASLLAILVGCGVAAVGIPLVPYALRGYNADVVREAQLLLLVIAPQFLLWNVFRAHLESLGEFSRSNMVLLIPTVVTLFALLALRASGTLVPATAALAYFVPPTLQTVWLAWRLWPRMTIQRPRVRNDARLLLSYGLRSWGLDIVNMLSLQLDQAVIVAFLSPAALGLYTIALAVSRIVNVLQQSLVAVLFPKASGVQPDEAIALVNRLGRISNLVSGAVAVLFVISVPQLLPLFYGHAFDGALGITRVLTFEAFLGGAAAVLSQAFLSTGRPQIMAVVQAVWLLVTMALLAALVPRMSLEGAAVALLISSMVRLGLVLAAYPFVLGRPMPGLVPTPADIRYVYSKLADLRRRRDHAPAG
jgi:O-antigen/teichoic acid export membrane protein